MGNRSTKFADGFNPSLTQTYHGHSHATPSEPMAPPSPSEQHAPCPLSTPTVSHAEWDECMRQSTLTIGFTTISAIAAGLMVPAADTLLLLGTGAGVLWSVKRCRTLMRDGILSQEQAEALEHKKRTEREEKRRQRMIEKEAKQKAAEQKSAKNPKKIGNAKDSSGECCTKLKKILEQEGVDHIQSEKTSRKKEEPQAKAKTIGTVQADESDPQVCIIQNNMPTKISGCNSMISNRERKGETTKPQPEQTYPQKLKTSGHEKHAKLLSKQLDTDKHSSVKLFAPYSRYLSESVILTCDRKACTCNSNKGEPNCTCDSKQPPFGEPQQYTLATDTENEDVPSKKDPDSPVAINSIANVMDDKGKNLEVGILAQNANHLESSNPKNDLMKQSVKDNLPQESTEEEEVAVVFSTVSNRTESLNDDIVEVTVDDNENLDVKLSDSRDGFDVEVIENDIRNEQVDQLKNEVEVVFAETLKSESWPFSFSLPSLDKFSKKKNNSFKWPPLTSSIVKPKKEPTCKCSDSSGTLKDTRSHHKSCTCGTSKNDSNSR